MTSLQSYLAELADLPDFVELGPISPHTRGNFGNTALHVAATRGELDALGWLLDAGADINAAGGHGYTPLHDAVEQHQREAVRFLLVRGASRSTTNLDGYTSQQLAELLGDEQTAVLLRDHAA